MKLSPKTTKKIAYVALWPLATGEVFVIVVHTKQNKNYCILY